MTNAVTPTVRRGYTVLDNGKCIMAIGDVHVVNDPLIAQGANSASYSAWVLSEAILEDAPLDERFCQQAEQRI